MEEMKFEFVDFYPAHTDPKKKKNHKARSCLFLGTVHLYWIDGNADIRGIIVRKIKKCYLYSLPLQFAFDENGKKIWYPAFSFTEPKNNKLLLDFLHQKVTPEIEKFYAKTA